MLGALKGGRSGPQPCRKPGAQLPGLGRFVGPVGRTLGLTSCLPGSSGASCGHEGARSSLALGDRDVAISTSQLHARSQWQSHGSSLEPRKSAHPALFRSPSFYPPVPKPVTIKELWVVIWSWERGTSALGSCGQMGLHEEHPQLNHLHQVPLQRCLLRGQHTAKPVRWWSNFHADATQGFKPAPFLFRQQHWSPLTSQLSTIYPVPAKLFTP